MGGSKGGGGTQTVQQNADPWSGAQPYIKEGLHNLQQYGQGVDQVGENPFGGGISAPPFYPGSTVAPMSPWTSGALQAQALRGAQGSPVTDAAQGQTYDTLRGAYFDNPNLTAAINYATSPVEAAVTSAFSSAGRYGGDSHVDALTRGIGDIASNMAYQNYGDERNRQQQAAAMAPQLAQQDYFDINQVGASGSALDAFNQAQINADVERYNYGNDANWRRTQDYLATIQGVAPTGSQSTSRTSPNAFSSAMGGAMGLAGLGSMLMPMLGGGLGSAGLGSALAGALAFSDEDLKWGAERVGELDNGLPIYRYRYLWEDEGDAAHLGVMAQEALEVKPEAVGLLHGFLAVDYDRVTEDA